MTSLVRNQTAPLRNDVKCIICDHMISKPVYRYQGRGESDILQCGNCGHLFIHPVPLQDLKERTMDALTDAEFFGNEWMKWLHERIVINKEIREVKTYLSAATPRLLDIGCGTGWSTSIWQKNGFAVTGLEPSLTRGQVARDVYKLNVSHEHLENFVTPELFDVIVLRHLLEHIAEPKKMLIKIKSFLKPDGILLIVIPNINCIGRYLFGSNWAWILPWHLHFYTPATLKRLLEKVGYEKRKIYQMPSPLWYPNAVNNAFFGENSKVQIPPFIALLFCIPVVLIGALLNLNDNMTLIFRNTPTHPEK